MEDRVLKISRKKTVHKSFNITHRNLDVNSDINLHRDTLENELLLNS